MTGVIYVLQIDIFWKDFLKRWSIKWYQKGKPACCAKHTVQLRVGMSESCKKTLCYGIYRISTHNSNSFWWHSECIVCLTIFWIRVLNLKKEELMKNSKYRPSRLDFVTLSFTASGDRLMTRWKISVGAVTTRDCIFIQSKKVSLGPWYWYVPVLVNTGTFLVHQYCLKMWYLWFLEHASDI